jgi:hypothetical protein
MDALQKKWNGEGESSLSNSGQELYRHSFGRIWIYYYLTYDQLSLSPRNPSELETSPQKCVAIGMM